MREDNMIDKRMKEMLAQAFAASLAPKAPDTMDTIGAVEAHVNARLTRGTVKVYRAMVNLLEPDSVTFYLTCEGTAREFSNIPMRVDLPRDGRGVPDNALAEYFARELARTIDGG